MENKGGTLQEAEAGLTESDQQQFRSMAVDSLKHKKNWTHGEIVFEFALKQRRFHASVQMESNYNMANVFVKG